MIINALSKYYEILAEDGKSGIPLNGYSSAKVGYALNISLEGELLDVISLKVEGDKGKKLISRTLTVPEQIDHGVKIFANFMCDNSTYVLGIDNKGKPIRSKDAFVNFKELHNKVLKNAKDKAGKSILAFLENWDISEARQHPVLIDYLDDILEGNNIVFILDGERDFIHNDDEIKCLWEKYISDNEDDLLGKCLVTGNETLIARTHTFIKNVRGTKSNSASIVSFNAQSYESYGKIQSYNSPIGKNTVFAYTTVLNYMLSNHKQKVQIGDATTVFWAESPEEIYTDLAAELLNPCIDQDVEKSTGNRRDKKIEATIKEVLLNARLGNRINKDLDKEINPLTKFYVLGLSPNASRISIRFFHSDNFGEFVEKIIQHYKDIEIIKDFDNRADNIPIWMLLKETISPKSTDKDAKPLLAGSIMRSILCGGMYSQSLYNSILQRVKTDGEIRVNYVRASIVKAFLIRKGRITKNKIFEEVSTVALNEQTTEKAYLLGRLFAILEKTQNDAGNVTIRAKYFASAMTTPGAVFPILLRLAQHHISKAEYGFLNDKKIESIIQNIDSFPSHLTLDQQGIFILGYYHQRSKLWEKQIKEIQNIKEEN
ncbi:MAG: type I-C CRISPR-associated protein Cas8c/Csd1 [Vulcanibacillus sp.]